MFLCASFPWILSSLLLVIQISSFIPLLMVVKVLAVLMNEELLGTIRRSFLLSFLQKRRKRRKVRAQAHQKRWR